MAETETIQSIMGQSTFEATVDYCGNEYRTYIWSTTRSDDSGATIRVIIGEKDWPLCPAEWAIEKCFIVCINTFLRKLGHGAAVIVFLIKAVVLSVCSGEQFIHHWRKRD